MGRYTITIPKPSVQVMGVVGFLLFATAGFSQGPLINEYMTANRTVLADEEGRFSDWFEIYNNAPVPTLIDGWMLDDHPSDTVGWRLPSITLGAYERLLLFASGKDKGQLAPFNETVVMPGDSCRYIIPVTEPANGWTWPDIDDGEWQFGYLSLGYGDGDDTTVVPTATSLYIRIDFEVESLTSLNYAILHADYDDGFVAYVNGAEIARANVGGTPPTYDSLALDEHEARMYQGGKPEMFYVPDIAEYVRIGRNVLSIQVHNADPFSSDLSIIPYLTLGLNAPPANPRGVAEAIGGFLLQLHTDFKLAPETDTLILRNGDGLVVDQVVIEEAPVDMSRGRAPDGSGIWRIFQFSTPGETNPPTGATFVTPRADIDPPAGFYHASVTVTLSNDSAQAQIYYTLNGAPPTESSPLYTGPFRLDTSCVVRFMGRIPGELPSNERVTSYIIGPGHTLPVFSLSTNPPNLWDEETGIYAFGPSYDPSPPYRGANFWQPWERPVHVEFFETDGTEELEQDAGVKIHGGWTRAFPQKSLRLKARANYGTGSFGYRFFPDRNIDRFEEITLRNGGSDWDHTMFRDGLLTGLMKDVYPHISAYRPAIVYINGAYWGIQNIREVMNQNYVAGHFGVDDAEVDVFEVWGEKMNGDWPAYNELVNFFATHDLSDPANYRMAEDLIDIDEYALYNAVNVYVDNGDWPGNNNRFFRIRGTGEKWHWFLLDLDFGFGLHGANSWTNNSLADALADDGPVWPNPPAATLYLRKMCQSPIFRTKFINAFADLMNFQFQPGNVINQMNEKKAALEPEIDRQLLRWGRNRTDWEEKVNEIPAFATNRPTYMRQFVEQQFNLPGHATISLSCDPPVGGNIKINEYDIPPAGWSGIYFRTIPVTIEAIPQPGYRFLGWTGGSVSTNPRLIVALDNDRTITALFALAPGVVGLPVINEINYNSSDSFDVGDWVEIAAFNGEVDLSNWTLTDSDTAHLFVFPIGTVIPPGRFLIVSEDTTLFDSLFPGRPNVIGNLDFNFGAGGDQVKLLSPRGEVIDSVGYDDIDPWPTAADGLGSTLELLAPSLPNDDPANWRASLDLYGSPAHTNEYNPPGVFSLLSPPDGWTIRTDSVLVSWSKSEDNDSGDTVRYTVEWSLDGIFPAYSATTLDTSYYISETVIAAPTSSRRTPHIINGLPDRAEIHWRVKAIDTHNFVRVATPGDSGWSFKVLLTEIPVEFGLQPIFPNPFNDRVQVTIDVAAAGEVEVVFFDLLGREVYSRKDLLNPGSHRLFFPPDNGSRLASGIYWVRASQGDKTELAKMVLVR